MRAKILDLIEKKGDLPAFPDILTKLQKILDNPYAGVADVTRLIKLDPVLAGNILKISNSAYYKSGYEKIETLQTSVNKLGLEKIRQLAFSLKITKMFSHNKLVDSFEFWKHSLAVANFTEMLSQYTKVSQENRSIARLAGLMHDIGIMVFCYIIPDEYSVFLENVNKEEIPLEKQEEKAFGIDHQEAGAKFIEKWWQVDKQIVRAVRYHHLPFDGTKEERQCQQLVHMADGICVTFGQANGIECYSSIFNTGAWEALGLSLDDVEKMMSDVQVSIDQAIEILGSVSK